MVVHHGRSVLASAHTKGVLHGRECDRRRSAAGKWRGPPTAHRQRAIYQGPLLRESRAPHSLLQQKEPPEVQLSVDVKAQSLGQGVYEVLLTVSARAMAGGAAAAGPGGGDPVFVTELTYAAVVTLRDTPQELVPVLLLVETPRLLFPFVRSVIANATREGGFPPLLIHPIDFAELLRRQQTAVPAPGAPGIATA